MEIISYQYTYNNLRFVRFGWKTVADEITAKKSDYGKMRLSFRIM